MSPLIKKMAESFNASRPKFTLGIPELIFGLYSLIATITRPLIPTLLIAINVTEFETMYISFIISFSITCFFLSISFINKIDWYGKKETGLVFFVINKINKKYKLLILFICDSFLFFIYHKKNSKLYKTVMLFTLSSIIITILWEMFGILLVLLAELIKTIWELFF